MENRRVLVVIFRLLGWYESSLEYCALFFYRCPAPITPVGSLLRARLLNRVRLDANRGCAVEIAVAAQDQAIRSHAANTANTARKRPPVISMTQLRLVRSRTQLSSILPRNAATARVRPRFLKLARATSKRPAYIALIRRIASGFSITFFTSSAPGE